MNGLIARSTLAAAGALSLWAGQAAVATTLGYDTPDPFWTGGDAGTAYVTFDTFTATSQFGTTITPTTGTVGSSDNITSPQLTLPQTGVILAGSGDRVYDFGAATTWTLSGTTDFDAKTVILQIKQYQSSSYTMTAPLLSGLASDFASVVNVVEGANTQTIATFAWFDALTSTSITNLSITFGSAANTHTSFDGLQLDVSDTYQVVPEPATMALLASGILLIGCRRRRSEQI